MDGGAVGEPPHVGPKMGPGNLPEGYGRHLTRDQMRTPRRPSQLCAPRIRSSGSRRVTPEGTQARGSKAGTYKRAEHATAEG